MKTDCCRFLLVIVCCSAAAFAQDANPRETVDPIVKASPYGTKEVYSYAEHDGLMPWTKFHPHDYGSAYVAFSGEGVRDVGKAPAPGVHPRLFFSPEDLPAIRKRIKEDRGAHEAWLNLLAYAHALRLDYDESADYAKPDWVKGSWWIHGRVTDMHLFGGYAKDREDYYGLLAQGKFPDKTYNNTDNPVANFFLPASAEAYRCLIEEDIPSAQKLATAVVNAVQFEQERCAKNDKPVSPGNPPNPSTPRFAAANLGLIYDFLYNYMTPDQQKTVRDELVTLSAWHDNYGTFNNAEAGRSNWASFSEWALDLMAIQGEPGFNDLKFLGLYRGWRNFYTYSFFDSGAAFEGEGKLLFGLEAVVAFDRVAPLYGLEPLTHHPMLKRLFGNFAPLSIMPTQDGYVRFDMLGGLGGNNGLESLVTAHYLFPQDRNIDFVYRCMVGNDYSSIPSNNWQAWNNCVVSAVFATSFDPQNTPENLHLPLTFFCGQRAMMITRSSWDRDATLLAMHVRGASGGHPYRDRNGLMLSGQGRVWVTIPWDQDIGGWACNTVRIDNADQNATTPGRVVDFVDAPQASFMTGDAKYCWDWVWNSIDKDPDGTPLTQDDVANFQGKRDGAWTPVEQCFNDFAWTKVDRKEFTMPLKFNHDWCAPDGCMNTYVRQINTPVLKCFRSAGLVRGARPYVLVVDDVQRDDFPTQYDWNLSFPQDVQKIDYSSEGLSGQPGDLYFAWKADLNDQRVLKDGAPALLIRVVGCQGQRAPDQFDLKDKLNILTISTRAVAPDFRVLLYPFHKGDPIPDTSLAPSARGNLLKVSFPHEQEDEITLSPDPASGRTCVAIKRDQEELLRLNRPISAINDPDDDLLVRQIKTMRSEAEALQKQSFVPTRLGGFQAGWSFATELNSAYPPIPGSDAAESPVPKGTTSLVDDGLSQVPVLATRKEALAVPLPFISQWNNGHPFALSVWTKIKVDAWMGSIFNSNWNQGLSLNIIQARLSYCGLNCGEYMHSPTSMLSSWTHFLFSDDGATLNIYRNGYLLGVITHKDKQTQLEPRISLGGDNGYGDAEAEFRNLYIYNRALTPDEARAIYLYDRFTQ